MTRPFDKPATTYARQVEILRSHGMVIDDADEAAFYLQHLNYYRLAAYWLPFEADHGSHRFRPGTHFNDALNLYVFDRELRLLVMDAIERFEVSVRSQWAFQMAHHHGPHAHLDRRLAKNAGDWEQNLESLTNEVDRSSEVFIEHHRNTYSEPLPPVWAVCEVMSLGLLSRWYKNLNPMPTRRAIASVYELDDLVLASWLYHLASVRNTCAHHGRLWNRKFVVVPKIPRTKPQALAGQFGEQPRKLYNTLVFLLHCMDVIAPHHTWRERLKNLLSQHTPPTPDMGFPTNWQTLPIWQ